jgi:diguanylate cyclase (GGDEF)-like protein/PAS domain S-box-containing protein
MLDFSRMIRIALSLWLCTLCWLATAAEPVRIGVLAYRPKAQTLAQWQPLAQALKQAIPERDFRVEAYSFPELEAAVARKQVDFVLTNPGHFVLISHQQKLSAPLATLVNDVHGTPSASFGGVVFSLRGRGLDTPERLHGKTVAFTSTMSLGGYQMQALALREAGLDLKRDTLWLTTGAPHDKVVQAVLSGRADAGLVRTGLLEELAGEGRLRLEDIEVMHLPDTPDGQLPWLTTTELYPEWPFVALAGVDAALAKRVAVALLQLPHDAPLTRAMGIHGFTIPADYGSIEHLLLTLRMPPFDRGPAFTLSDIWARYALSVVLGALGLLVIAGLLFRLWLTNRSLAIERQRVLMHSQALRDSEFRWQCALEGTGDGMWDWDLQDNRVEYSRGWLDMLGYAPGELPAHYQAWLDLLHPQDRTAALAGLAAYLDGHHGHYQLEFRLRSKQGDYKWILSRGMVVSRGPDDQPLRMIGTHTDISERHLAERHEQFRSRVLDLLARGEPLPALLMTVVHEVEQMHPAMLCSILLLNSQTGCLGQGIAPSLPAFYNAAVEGLKIGPDVGSCGAAAHRGQRVVVADIAHHPNWAPYAELACQAGLAACWSQPILSADGQVLGTFAIYHRQPHTPTAADIVLIEQCARLISLAIERRQAEAQLAESETRYRSLIELAHEGIVVVQDGRICYCNPTMEHMANAGPAGLYGQGFLALVHADDQRQVARQLHPLPGSSGHGVPRCQFRLGNGESPRWIEMSSTPINWQGRPAMLNSLSDISERRRTEQQLQLAASVFVHAREGIMITDAEGNIIDVNDTFTRITGYSRDEALGQNPRMLRSGRHDREFYAAMWRSLLDKGHWYGEIWNQRKNGEIFAEMQTISAVCDEDGHTRHYVALFSDITLIKAHEQQLEHIAHYDALTGLPNRVLLADRLQQAMSQTQRRSQRLAVVYLDLDGFKAINDRHGHDIGDQLLMQLARRMRDTLRDSDTLARLGGDEFVAVLMDLDDTQASAPALTRLLAAAAQPVMLGNQPLQVSASLGVTFYPQEGEVDADQLMRQADQAMYQAKLAGKNRYHLFDAAHDHHIKGQHESLDRIRRALQAGEFVLHYQPKVNMRRGEVIGAEALLRWQHPDKGLLPPAAFLPLVDAHPLAVDLGEWVIDQALTQMSLWQAQGLILPVSVNIGARQLQQARFVSRLREILDSHAEVDPEHLELEILETSALEDLAEVAQVIAACRAMGVKFALDDFGTGYSSLTYLKHLQVARLKIDQSFVRDMLDDPDDLAILSGVIGLAAAFRRDVIAEGVETAEHGAMLLQLGCEEAQGYGIARPMPASKLPAWAAHWQGDPNWRNLPALNRDDLPLLFARTELRAWMTAVTLYLRGERASAPTLDEAHSRFAHWLANEGARRHGAEPLFIHLCEVHAELHAFGRQLCQASAQPAPGELGQLHQRGEVVLATLRQLARNV